MGSDGSQGPAQSYRPVPAAVVEIWQSLTRRDSGTATALIDAARGANNPDGTSIDLQHLKRLAIEWAALADGGCPGSHIVLCPAWACERPVDERSLASHGCPHCGVTLRPMLRFPALSQRLSQQLREAVVLPHKSLRTILVRLGQVGCAPWSPERTPAAGVAEIDRYLSDLERNVDRITVALAGEKNRGKSTLANIMAGLTDRTGREFREAFPSLHIVNTHVAKEVLVPGGRLLDLPGINSLEEQHDIEAEKRIQDAEAVVLVVNAGSPLLEPEFRFLRDHVVRPSGARSGDPWLIVALSKIDAIRGGRRQRQEGIQDAIDFVLRGGGGHVGVTSLVPEACIQVIPVSGLWHLEADPDRAERRVRDMQNRIVDHANLAAEADPPPRIRRSGLALTIQVEPAAQELRKQAEAARIAMRQAFGGACVPAVRSALDAVAELVAPASPPAATVGLQGTILRSCSVFVVSAIGAWLLSAPPIAASLVATAVATTAAVLDVAWMRRRLRAAHKELVLAMRQASALALQQHLEHFARVGLRALELAPERNESGIPQLASAVAAAVTHNGQRLKLAQHVGVLHKRCAAWTATVATALQKARAAEQAQVKSLSEVQAHERLAGNAAESAVCTSMGDLNREMCHELDAIVSEEARGFKAFVKILWGKENSSVMQNIQHRAGQVIQSQRIESWLVTDTQGRVNEAVRASVERLGDRLQGIAADLGRTMSTDRGAPRFDLSPLLSGGARSAAGGALVVAAVPLGKVIGAAIGTAIAPGVGTAIGAGIGAGIGVALCAVGLYFGAILAGKGVNALAEVRNDISTRLTAQLQDQLLLNVAPRVVDQVHAALRGPFAKTLGEMDKELQAVRQDVQLLDTAASELRALSKAA